MSLVIDLPPDLERRLEAAVPEGERAAFIRDALEGKLAALPQPGPQLTGAARLEAVRAARGIAAGRGPSVDAFCREKQEEIDLEDRIFSRETR